MLPSLGGSPKKIIFPRANAPDSNVSFINIQKMFFKLKSSNKSHYRLVLQLRVYSKIDELFVISKTCVKSIDAKIVDHPTFLRRVQLCTSKGPFGNDIFGADRAKWHKGLFRFDRNWLVAY